MESRAGKEAGSEFFGLPFSFIAVDPLPVFQVKACADVEDVVAQGMGSEPACPGVAEAVVNADVALNDDFAEAAAEAPGDELHAKGLKDGSEIGALVEVELRC
jgi:hypothetical protein